MGHNALGTIHKIISPLRLNGPGILVCDNNTKKIVGNMIADKLNEHGYPIEIFEITDANEKNIEEARNAIVKTGATYTIGAGGGRCIDIAKYSAFLENIEFISAPTAASHDGIISGRASIRSEGRARSLKAKPPLMLLADTSVISRAPFKLLKGGYGDVISNYTAVKDWELSQRLTGEPISTYSCALSKMSAELLIQEADSIKPGMEESAWKVIKALIASGVAMAIAGSSRPASGAEHMFSHTLDLLLDRPALHGEQCALGSIITMYLHGGNWQFIREAMQKIGLATSARALSIPDDAVVEALVKAPKVRPSRFTILGDGISEEAAHMALQYTKIIG